MALPARLGARLVLALGALVLALGPARAQERWAEPAGAGCGWLPRGEPTFAPDTLGLGLELALPGSVEAKGVDVDLGGGLRRRLEKLDLGTSRGLHLSLGLRPLGLSTRLRVRLTWGAVEAELGELIPVGGGSGVVANEVKYEARRLDAAWELDLWACRGASLWGRLALGPSLWVCELRPDRGVNREVERVTLLGAGLELGLAGGLALADWLGVGGEVRLFGWCGDALGVSAALGLGAELRF